MTCDLYQSHGIFLATCYCCRGVSDLGLHEGVLWFVHIHMEYRILVGRDEHMSSLLFFNPGFHHQGINQALKHFLFQFSGNSSTCPVQGRVIRTRLDIHSSLKLGDPCQVISRRIRSTVCGASVPFTARKPS